MTTSQQQASYELAMEIRGNSWRGLTQSGGFEIPIQRNEQGYITTESKESIVESINKLINSTSPKPSEIVCAISSGGLLLRSMELPPTNDEALSNLVELQLEKEWPLPPEDLAWGYQKIKPPHATESESDSTPINIVIAAVKRPLFQQYNEILNACGLQHARWVTGASIGSLMDEIKHLKNAWLIDIQKEGTHLIYHEWGLPITVQLIQKGWQQLQSNIKDTEQSTGDSINADSELPLNDNASESQPNSVKQWAAPILDFIQLKGAPPAIMVSGENACLELVQPFIQETFPGIPIQSYALKSEPGHCLTTHVLTSGSGQTLVQRMIQLETQQEMEMAPAVDKLPFLRWGVLLAALVIAIFLARRVEPSLKTGKLEAQLIEFREQKKRLPEIDRELSFLEHVQNKSLPYMDLIGLLAEHAPRGFQLESLDMGSDRRVQLRGLVQGAHTEDLRAKLLATDWFEQVVLDEQTPDRDGRKITVRITLLVKEHLKRPKISLAMLGIDPKEDEDKEKKGGK